jgi:hypothetical protein
MSPATTKFPVKDKTLGSFSKTVVADDKTQLRSDAGREGRVRRSFGLAIASAYCERMEPRALGGIGPVISENELKALY